MIAIDVAAPFLIPLKLALLLSIVVTAPWIYH
jgi:Sec-independent protein secretion pathway component TatC